MIFTLVLDLFRCPTFLGSYLFLPAKISAAAIPSCRSDVAVYQAALSLAGISAVRVPGLS